MEYRFKLNRLLGSIKLIYGWRIPQSFIDDLLFRVDIVEVINSRVQLKKARITLLAVPFIMRKHLPSVAPDKQFYYCFGCGATGNAIKFLME